MDDTLLFVAMFSGIWCLVGAVFLAVGIGMGRAWRRKEERMRDTADGVILEMVRHTSHSSDGTSTSWCPLVEFEYEGRRISLEGESVSRKRYYEGQAVRVRFDPDDPACFAIDGDNSGRLFHVVFTAVGALCVAVGVISAVIVLAVRPSAGLRALLRRG